MQILIRKVKESHGWLGEMTSLCSIGTPATETKENDVRRTGVERDTGKHFRSINTKHDLQELELDVVLRRSPMAARSGWAGCWAWLPSTGFSTRRRIDLLDEDTGKCVIKNAPRKQNKRKTERTRWREKHDCPNFVRMGFVMASSQFAELEQV